MLSGMHLTAHSILILWAFRKAFAALSNAIDHWARSTSAPPELTRDSKGIHFSKGQKATRSNSFGFEVLIEAESLGHEPFMLQEIRETVKHLKEAAKVQIPVF